MQTEYKKIYLTSPLHKYMYIYSSIVLCVQDKNESLQFKLCVFLNKKEMLMMNNKFYQPAFIIYILLLLHWKCSTLKKS